MTEKDVTDSQDLSRDNSKQQVVSSSYDDPSITDSNGFAAIIQVSFIAHVSYCMFYINIYHTACVIN